MTPFQRVVKRGFDTVAAATGLILISPALLLMAVAVRLESKGPVLFRSTRLGRDGRPFELLKFRSMHVNSPERYNPDGSMLVADEDPRVTRVGRFLRAGWDELPQLINVLRGEMSVVGPRPDPPFALQEYRDGEERRLLFRPGITGWAQVHGRTNIPWHARLALDLEYVDHYSLLLDLKVLFLTLFELAPVLRQFRSRRAT